ncbi:hypothetical protein [Spirochaeta dissipatitropha]
MILFMLFSISIAFLSLPAKAVALVYLPVLFKLSKLRIQYLSPPLKIAVFFSLIILAARVFPAADQSLKELLTSTIDTGSSYFLLLSLGVWISRSMSSAELSAILQTPVQLTGKLAGHRAGSLTAAFISIIPVALSLFNRLRGIARSANQAVSLRCSRFSIHSVRYRAGSMTRLGTELALSTADSLILRGWNPETMTEISGDRQRHLSLLPLLLISAVDIFIAILYSA